MPPDVLKPGHHVTKAKALGRMVASLTGTMQIESAICTLAELSLGNYQ